MINFNGNLLERDVLYLNGGNRGLKYGDALFETLRTSGGKIFFLEDHYLRLMASMRILRMEIPMNFTMEYMEGLINQTLEANQLANTSSRVRLTVFRNEGGLYTPLDNNVSYIIETEPLENPFYLLSTEEYRVELFKDYVVNGDMLSNLKTNNKALNVVGSVFAQENGYHNCLLLNHDKNVVEALNGNLFLVKGSVIKTAPLSDGCLNGIIRKKIIGIVQKLDHVQLEESSISPFELQKADELFITNTIIGIQPITSYRKARFESKTASGILGKLNALARLS